MQTVLWSLLGIVAGACIAIQAPINAELARGLGSAIAAAAVSFLAGAVALASLTAASGSLAGYGRSSRAAAMGLCRRRASRQLLRHDRDPAGAAHRRGSVMGLAIAGQLLAGVLLDRIGFMGLPVHEITAGRAVGGLLLIAGALMIRLT